MTNHSVFSNEFDNIARSLGRMGIDVYMKMLQCPNMKQFKGELLDISASENFELFSGKITEKCNYFQCDAEKQIFPCEDGKCPYIDELHEDLAGIGTRFKQLSQELLT